MCVNMLRNDLVQLFQLSLQLQDRIPNITCGLFDFDWKIVFTVDNILLSYY